MNVFSAVHAICATAGFASGFHTQGGWRGRLPKLPLLAGNVLPAAEKRKEQVYVVTKGRIPGVYQVRPPCLLLNMPGIQVTMRRSAMQTWEECQQQVSGFSGALYKKAESHTLQRGSSPARAVSKNVDAGGEGETDSSDLDAAARETAELKQQTKRARTLKQPAMAKMRRGA
eukprot:1787965-Rhodomonas_salina.1